MTIIQLEYLVAVDRLHSFSKAAEFCHVSQPSLSVQIQKLEEELGSPLFDRNRAQIITTDFGIEIIRQAKIILNESARLSEIANSWKNEIKGELQLGVIPTIAPYILPLFTAHFQKKYPEIKLQITEEKTHSLIELLTQGELDAAILSTPQKSPLSLVEKPLFYEPFLIYASSQNSLLKKKQIHYSELSSSGALLLDDTHCMRDQVSQICKFKDTKAVQQPSVQLKTGALPTLISLVESHDGFTLIPYLAVTQLKLDKKNLREFEKPYPTRKMSLVYSETRHKKALVDALYKEIIAHLPEGLYLSSSQQIKVFSPEPEHFVV